MKKRFLSAIIIGIIGAASALFLPNNIYAEENTAITSPEMRSPNKKPGYNDTYFTYYNSIIGYKSNELWGFYNRSRSINIPAMYTDIEGLNSKYIKVKQNGVWGLISTDGYQLIQPEYDDIDTFNIGTGDHFLVKSYGYTGVVDAYNNELVPLQFQSVSKLNDSYVKVSQNNKYGVFDIYNKKVIISIFYDNITVLDQWFKVKRNGKWGLIDKMENIIIPAKYDDIRTLNSSYFAVKTNKLWGTAAESNGEEVISPRYDKIEFYTNKYLKVKQNGKWGAVTYDGTIVLPIVRGPFEINKDLKKIY